MAVPGTLAPTDRLAWLDYAKAIGIVLVVFGHASRSIERTGGLVWSDTLQSLDSVIYTFHMPLFFLIAGYVAGLQKHQAPASFAKSLWWGIAVPYFVWSAIWICLKVMLPDAANVPLDLSVLSQILWQPVEHLWFLYHLFYIRLGWYVATTQRQWSPTRQGLLILAAVAVSVVLPIAAPALEWVAGFAKNFAIYGAGLTLLPLMLGKFAERPVGNLVTLGGALCLWGFALGGAGQILLALGGALAVAGIAKALPLPVSAGWRAVAFLGEASLAIYVMHLLAGAAVRVALTKSGHLSEAALLALATLAGLILPAVAYWMVLSCGHWLAKPLARWLGLGPATRSAYIPLWGAAPIKKPFSPI